MKKIKNEETIANIKLDFKRAIRKRIDKDFIQELKNAKRKLEKIVVNNLSPDCK